PEERRAQRRPADGRGQPRRAARLPHQLALRRLGRPVLSGWDPRLGGQARRRARGRDVARLGFLRRFRYGAGAPDPPPGRRLAVGHAASVAAVIALLGVVQFLAAPDALRYAAGLGLLTVGVVKLAGGGSHPRWVGMRVSMVDLGIWSFLMATAHGAGLMLVPV